MISVVRWRIYLCVCRVIYICVLICSYTIYCIYIYNLSIIDNIYIDEYCI
jgi:hypothetical protein